MSKVNMESFSLSHDDVQDRDQWRLKIGEPASPGFTWKMAVKTDSVLSVGLY